MSSATRTSALARAASAAARSPDSQCPMWVVAFSGPRAGRGARAPGRGGLGGARLGGGAVTGFPVPDVVVGLLGAAVGAQDLRSGLERLLRIEDDRQRLAVAQAPAHPRPRAGG